MTAASDFSNPLTGTTYRLRVDASSWRITKTVHDAGSVIVRHLRGVHAADVGPPAEAVDRLVRGGHQAGDPVAADPELALAETVLLDLDRTSHVLTALASEARDRRNAGAPGFRPGCRPLRDQEAEAMARAVDGCRRMAAAWRSSGFGHGSGSIGPPEWLTAALDDLPMTGGVARPPDPPTVPRPSNTEESMAPADRRAFWGCFDCAPSEQLNDPGAWHSIGIVVARSERQLEELVDSHTRPFQIRQYKPIGGPVDRAAYAKEMLSVLEGAAWSGNVSLWVFTSRGHKIISDIPRLWRRFAMESWIGQPPPGYDGRFGPLRGRDAAGDEFEIGPFPTRIGIMPIWIADAMATLFEHAREADPGGGIPRWSLVGDQLAGDDEDDHPKALILSGCLNHLHRGDLDIRCEPKVDRPPSDTRVQCIDLADSVVGVARDCIIHGRFDDWKEIQRRLLALPNFNWVFDEDGPPWATAPETP